MAASAWTIPNQTKKLLGEGSIDLQGGNFKIALVRRRSAGDIELSEGLSALTFASLITDGVLQISDVGGWSSSGKALANVSWTLSGSNVKFDCQDFSFSTTAALSNLFQAVIIISAGNRIACYCCLSSAAFDLASGNKLIIQMNSSGIFTLN